MTRFDILFLCLPLSCVLTIARPVTAGDVIPPVSERFSGSSVTETPDFQKHLVPLLGRLGCNGRACHGSFSGQGGFQLSLFGYDFDMDHKNLLERIDTDAPADSYALEKPTLQTDHEGGQRMKVGSWEYNVFLNWIAGGAKGTPKPAPLQELVVTPAEVQFTKAGQTRQLQAVAVWADGTREDVTCLCRFNSNDDAICKVGDAGLVTSGEMGDSHIVISYDGAVVPVPVIRPVSDQIGDRYPDIATHTPIDRQVVAKLRKLGVVPSEVCDDAEFLRRVSLDITGTLPTAREVRAFLADDSSDKRQRKINELLETPAYAAWWTTRLCDWTGCSDQQLNNVNPAARQRGSEDWYAWIYQRVASNMPYDTLCEKIILANSREPGEDYRAYCERMSGYARDKSESSFADNDTLIYFWGRRNFRSSEDRAIAFAYTFMGTRIQCAQCHKHPFDVWTKQDFEEFERFFTPVRFANNGTDRGEYRDMIQALGVDDLKGNQQRRALERAVRDGKTIPFPEIDVRSTNSRRKRDDRPDPRDLATLLGEQQVNLSEVKDPRVELMDWLRNSPTRLFAKAIVNRVWSNYFHRGIVEPTDDLSLANPPCNQALLDYLVAGLIENDYDLKWLHREICNSDTYQRSWRPNETNSQDDRNFSRAVPRRLPAEVALDMLTMATSNDQTAGSFRNELDGHATTNTSPPRNPRGGEDYVLAVFGRSTRESNCDCDRSSDASLLQTLFVRNDAETLEMLTRRDGWLQQVTEADAQTEQAQKQLESLQRESQKLERILSKAQKQKDADKIRRAKSELQETRRELVNVRAKLRRDADIELTAGASRLIEEAYLRTLSRFPSDRERQIALEHIKQAGDDAAGLKDVMWALLNTKEFIVNH